jgi:hypothetical protein
VAIVPEKEENKIARELIFTAPMRFVRTNKSKQPEELIAKSRLIIPGHMDPQLGLYRTDAPTTSGLAVMVVATLAAGRGWYLRFFDVSTAFLSGKEIGRTVYVRRPVDGLPSVNGSQRVRPYKLMKVLKGAYGLTEAPRLWYLRARELLTDEIGFIELCCARAVFILQDKGETVAMLTLHVDDGMLAGDSSNRVYQKAVKDINSKFNIKEWHDLKQGTANYLGMRWKQDDQGVTLDMGDYIGNLTEMEIQKPTNEDMKLGDGAVHMFRSTLAKVRWPVSHVVPELAYAVSSLAQVSPAALEWDQARQLNLVVVALKKMAKAGQAQIVLPRLRGDKITVVTPFDASFAKEPGMKSQAGFVSFLTTGDVTRGEVPCALVEYQSTTISRVVKSTLASESASLSTALDRQLYLRLLVQSLLHGEPTYAPDWRHKLTIPGILVTDAKSLYDHLNTTGKIPKERQTMIDLLVARDLIEANAVKLMWVPTKHMLADILTKMMLAGDIFKRFRDKQVFSLIRDGEEQEEEQRRLGLRQGQRQRRKARDKAVKEED